MLARSLHATCLVLLHWCSHVTAEATHAYATLPTARLCLSLPQRPDKQWKKRVNQQEHGGGLDWQPVMANGRDRRLHFGTDLELAGTPCFSEWMLPDLNGFDFNGNVPTDASLEVELLTALYWGALCSELISCSTLFFPSFFPPFFVSVSSWIFVLFVLFSEEAGNWRGEK